MSNQAQLTQLLQWLNTSTLHRNIFCCPKAHWLLTQLMTEPSTNETLKFLRLVASQSGGTEAEAISSTGNRIVALAEASFVIEVERVLSTLPLQEACVRWQGQRHIERPPYDDVIAASHCRYFVPLRDHGRERYIEIHVRDIFGQVNPVSSRGGLTTMNYICTYPPHQPGNGNFGTVANIVTEMANPQHGRNIGVARPVDGRWHIGGHVENWGDPF